MMGKVIAGISALIAAGFVYSHFRSGPAPEIKPATQDEASAPANPVMHKDVSRPVSKQDTPEVKAPAAPSKLSDYDLQKEIEKRFESSYKDEMDKEDVAAKEDFFKFVHDNFTLRPDQEEQVRKLEAEMNDELSRAGNDAQKDRIIQEYASRLVPILGRPQQ